MQEACQWAWRPAGVLLLPAGSGTVAVGAVLVALAVVVLAAAATVATRKRHSHRTGGGDSGTCGSTPAAACAAPDSQETLGGAAAELEPEARPSTPTLIQPPGVTLLHPSPAADGATALQPQLLQQARPPRTPAPAASLPDGTHHVAFADGSAYYGEWRGGRMHGRGVFLWPSGARLLLGAALACLACQP